MLFKQFFTKRCAVFGFKGQCSNLLWWDTVRRCHRRAKQKEGWHQDQHTCPREKKCSHSPINIDPGKTLHKDFKPLTFTNYDTPNPQLAIVNTGHVGMSNKYSANHAHFHWGSASRRGSEHLIDYKAYPMEMHIVHYNTKYPTLAEAAPKFSGLSVLAFLFERTVDDNEALSPIISKLEYVRTPFVVEPLNLASLSSILPENKKHFYRYSDISETGDPSVMWTIFTDKIKISESQLKQFRYLASTEIDPNTREPKPLADNNRKPKDDPPPLVYRNFGGKD